MILFQCCFNVENVEITLYQRHSDLLCLEGINVNKSASHFGFVHSYLKRSHEGEGLTTPAVSWVMGLAG